MSAIPLLRPRAESKTAKISLLAFSLAAISSLQAAPIVWNGDGATPNWSDAENWQGNMSPQNSDELHFAGTTRLTSMNDINNLVTNGFVFDANAGSFTLQGNRLRALGAIINNSSALQTIDLDLEVEGHHSWTNTGPGSGTGIDINGDIFMNDGDHIDISGDRDIRIDGDILGLEPISLEYGTLAKFGSGTLQLNGHTHLSEITANDSGSIDLAGIHQFPDMASVTANDTSTINLSGSLSSGLAVVQMNDSSTFNVSGSFFHSIGQVTASEDASVNISGEFSTGDTTVTFSDTSDLDVSGDFRISDATLIASGNSTIDVSGNMDLSVQSFLDLQDNAQMNVSGSLTNNGGGAVFIGGNSALNLTGAGTADLELLENLGVFSAANKTESYGFDSDLANHGLVVGGSGSHILELTGDVWGHGNFEGNILFNGSYSPGEDPLGAALVTQQYSLFGSSSLLMMQLGGLERGISYDAINALTLDLAGILDIDLFKLGSQFMPTAGNSFDLLRAGTISGTFSVLNFSDAILAPGLAWSAKIVREDEFDIFRLSVVPGTGVPEPGTLLLLFVSLAVLLLREMPQGLSAEHQGLRYSSIKPASSRSR